MARVRNVGKNYFVESEEERMFKLEIKTGGAAFMEPSTGEEDEYYEAAEINRLLRIVGVDLRNGCTSGTLLDVNGNKVGSWSR